MRNQDPTTPDAGATPTGSGAHDLGRETADRMEPEATNTQAEVAGVVREPRNEPTSTEVAADRRNAEKQPNDDAGAERDEEYRDRMTTTRSGAVWAATIFSLVILVLLIIFIAQNQETTTLRYFAWEGTVNVGLTVLAAAVAGGIIVSLAGAARIIALKAQRRRQRRQSRS
ncbi:lipopolysaccharide assembly protein LapA domain-containing protein [Zhihengliuella sp.]|uniref:LapA family protein n=1 Tax=Zhihengliuella sp. TaxID=1954483 RepID=UPI002811837D|nr:lipopolysaccharide assembly protein LapA domain-containing protein [Zhihengliuella sp.]